MHEPVKPTRILRIDPSNPRIDYLIEAARVIKYGGLVIFPTETVYGLGADAMNNLAVRKIFEAKGRPLDNPLIVHISDINQLNILSDNVKEEVYQLAEKFWPGPLTVVLYRSERVPYEVCAGLETVAVRMPAHPVALKLIELSGTPIAAPSANPAGKPSPTSGEHVKRDMMGRVDVIIDSGETLYGVESTIIDITRDPPLLLRPGALPIEEIEKTIKKKIVIPEFARGLIEASEAIAPGMKYRHYAPSKPLQVIESSDYSNLERYSLGVFKHVKRLMDNGLKVVLLASSETTQYYHEVEILSLGSRKNLFEVARNLYKALRKIDELDIDIAVSEGFEEKGLGLTIMNRLRKASGYNIIRI
ncbi:MAG: threonylcarbamoyl-AMP synthase [Thaumarchaeota archaeon]|jgi:L-threonylcarbamoyladenylate synthase|nr:threonylcarbamoyl-AMP synthase [Candidatus Geocrenenecus arthurdayi]